MDKRLRASLVLAAAAMVAGCQTFPLKGWKVARPQPAIPLASAPVSGASLLKEGRALLREGRLSAAAASFRLAMMDQATAAEANNGLAVVYARLGRNDLAKRYFAAAIDLAPEDTRFAANLLRLQFDEALRRQTAPAMAFADPARPATERAPAARAHRLSDGAFQIRTVATPQAAPRVAVDVRHRVARIELPQAAPAVALAPAGTSAAQDTSKVFAFPQ